MAETTLRVSSGAPFVAEASEAFSFLAIVLSLLLLFDLSASTIPSAMQEGAGAIRAVIKIGKYPFAPFRQISRALSLTAKSGAAFLSCSRAKEPDRSAEQSKRVRNTANADLPMP